ncbi:MAG: hypothetical protein JSW58_15900 [Candidatus Latescibacterota bacterium]|nr:MAG: hypothetical protein JSW58_15900 [Candidatus Latescibacterota bacterium]
MAAIVLFGRIPNVCRAWLSKRLWRVGVLSATIVGLASTTCLGDGLDSLVTHTSDGVLSASFYLPLRDLKEAGIEKALDELALDIECRVSIEVKQRGRFRSKTFTKTTWVTTLSYSRWYDEYVIAENAEETFTHQSYYQSIDRFRRFSGIPIVNIAILEPGREYTATVDVTIRPRIPSQAHQESRVGMASAGAFDIGGELVKQGYDLMKKKDMFHVKFDSAKFTTDAIPSPLFGEPDSEAP